MTANVRQLGEVAELEVQMLNLVGVLLEVEMLNVTAIPPFCQTACYTRFVLLLSL
jgi:hypothetical protein